MGGVFGTVLKRDCIAEVFFGTDYHSHLGTKTGGIAAYDKERGLQREIHRIANSPFRTKFEHIFEQVKGTSAIGCISDQSPQPLTIRSNLGTYCICMVGVINNAEILMNQFLSFSGGHLNAMTGGAINSAELLAAMINQKSSFAEGIKFAQKVINGSANILILKDDGTLIAARDRVGRLPLHVGKNQDGYCVALENFSYKKLGFEDEFELGPGEVVEISPDGIKQLVAPGKEMRVCSFLWSYYGYPTAEYEGVSVEVMRNRNGAIMAQADKERGLLEGIDSVSGVPDSGTPHAIGFANESRIPFARPFIKYTPTWPRSFMPPSQVSRNQVAKMKMVPVHDLIQGKNLLFVDDSIVRGTQLRETVEFLYSNGAKSVHMRSACPPIMFGCKYLNFSRSTDDMDLIARKVMFELEGEEAIKHVEEYADGTTERGKALRDRICKQLNFASLEYQSLEGLVKAIGLEKCKLCTYCWNGKE
ncbi:MAG: amidophosphoribosyltransferase [Clostridiales bacterium]|nr:amidophosphoribosyltransferase [Clostridiales bacterium]